MNSHIRWGILGTGTIAHEFATALNSVPGAELVAVGSRAPQAADSFGKIFNVPHRHACYEALAHDPDVDVIYVATPNSLHKSNCLLCLDAGKAVLCEKPFTINAAEAQAVIHKAREKQLFLMEAMWTRFVPAFVRVQEMLAEGVIGELRMIVADCGVRAPYSAHSRLFSPDLGGGALLDLGVYGVSLASLLFGRPDCINSMAYLGETGIDEQSTIQFGYRRGQIAVLSCALGTRTRKEAMIVGTDGYIVIHTPWWHPERFTVSVNRRVERVYGVPYESNALNYEALEVMRCLRNGQTESTVMPLDETLAVVQTMDQVRDQWGLVYPCESKLSPQHRPALQEHRPIAAFAQGTTMSNSRDAMRSFKPFVPKHDLSDPPRKSTIDHQMLS
jgi:predicted dehydrogenase